MNGQEFKTWRERVKLTQQQVADRFHVTRTTIQNWESSETPQVVDMGCQIWEARLRQEDPNIGPVTLIYTDAPMFVNPYGPRGRLAMLRQEAYPTNTAAIARVQQLSGGHEFHNPLILEESREHLWNSVQLERVVTGEDKGAPTLVNLLRTIAERICANSSNFVRSGSKVLNQTQVAAQQKAIEVEARKLEKLATIGHQTVIKSSQQIEGVFSRLLELGTRAPDSLVNNVWQAFAVYELSPSPTAIQSPFEYRGFLITWPTPRIDGSRWIVNVASDRRDLLARLGGRTIIITSYVSLANAIQQAQQHINELLNA